MRKILLAVCAAASVVVAAPAGATTFPSLTTIYIVPGVVDSGDAADNVGVATAFQCSNVSGVTTDIRFLVLSETGAVLSSDTVAAVAHGETIAASTHDTTTYTNELPLIQGTPLNTGVVNIESLQSAVFCTAAIIDASIANPDGVTPHIIRVNPHPGSVE